ncbi:MAG: OmpH family outer membrane protein [Candidatus Gastranaerophilales bacterium]|nr:OmpH family outer membrane protein [Candidatus Gastranaerophilales bacterium]
MKKSLLFMAAALVLSTVSAFAEDKIAVVDLQQIVSNSSQVKALKQEHNRKVSELDKILVNARGEIANETDQAKVLLLEDKYMKEFASKKEALERDYNNRLSAIEKNIKNEITKKAQKDGYDYIFAKSVVLFGGKDITNEIVNNIK